MKTRNEADFYNQYWRARFVVVKSFDEDLTFERFLGNPWFYLAHLADHEDPQAYYNLKHEFPHDGDDEVRDVLEDFDFEVMQAEKIYSMMLADLAVSNGPKYVLH